MLPLPHIDASLREMDRGFSQLGCVGVDVNISCLGRSVAKPEFEPIYAGLNRRGAIPFVHPSVTGVCSPVSNHWGCRASIGNSMEDAMFVAHMIARQIPCRYPNIRFIVPHLGGPIPMLLDRLDTQGMRDLGGLPELPSVTGRKFWLDTVCYGSKAALTGACEAFGADEPVASSDDPVLQDWEEYRETFAYIGGVGLSGDVANRLLRHDAQALFGFAQKPRLRIANRRDAAASRVRGATHKPSRAMRRSASRHLACRTGGIFRYFSVSVSPATNHLCISTTTTTGGSSAKTAVAMTADQSVSVSTPIIRTIPTTIVSIDGLVATSSGHRY